MGGVRDEEEGQLIRLAMANPRGLECSRLLEKHRAPLIRYINSTVRNPEVSEDICQSVLAKVIVKIRGFRFESSFRTWLFQIAHNMVMDHFRKESSRQRYADSVWNNESEITETTGVDLMENRDMADKLSQALEEVPEEMRSLLMMYAVNGMSYFEIAQASGLPPGTVKSRISRGRQIVMETLKKFRTRKQLSRLTNRGR